MLVRFDDTFDNRCARIRSALTSALIFGGTSGYFGLVRSRKRGSNATKNLRRPLVPPLEAPNVLHDGGRENSFRLSKTKQLNDLGGQQ